MPRAHRHFMRGLVWHITHRCHKKQFLLRFKKDRSQWLRWLFKARKRFDLCILNYVVTSNHIHLLVQDQGRGEIAKSMQLVAGCTARQFNRRKERKGAFWDDRYYATAVETDSHLARCIVYIDLNMVRAGAVQHPYEWQHGGYREIQAPPDRYRLIDVGRLTDILGFTNAGEMRAAHRAWVQDALTAGETSRQPQWTESVAVGRPSFLAAIKQQLRLASHGRRVSVGDHGHYLKDDAPPYT